MRLDAVLVDQPAEHLSRAIGAVAEKTGWIKIEALHRAFDHTFCGQNLGLPDRGRRFDINDDRVVDIDQVVGGIGEERLPTWAPVHRAAGSAGETNLGTTSVAAPKAASSSTARYSSTARPVASGDSPFSPSIPFCRFASALIRLASTATASPPTSPSRTQRPRTVSNS